MNDRYAITMGTGGAARADEVTLADGARVVLRPMRDDDEPRMAAFHAGLSPRSVYQRYFHISSLEQRLARLHLSLALQIDPALGVSMVAEPALDEGGLEIVGLGRVKRSEPGAAEIGLLVVDRWQGRGLGRAMMARLIEGARDLQVQRLHGDMLAGNDAMRALVRHAGFVVRPVPGDASVLRAELRLA